MAETDINEWMVLWKSIGHSFSFRLLAGNEEDTCLRGWEYVWSGWGDIPLGALYFKHRKANSVEYPWEGTTIWRLFPKFLVRYALFGATLPVRVSSGDWLKPFLLGAPCRPHIALPFLFLWDPRQVFPFLNIKKNTSILVKCWPPPFVTRDP